MVSPCSLLVMFFELFSSKGKKRGGRDFGPHPPTRTKSGDQPAQVAEQMTAEVTAEGAACGQFRGAQDGSKKGASGAPLLREEQNGCDNLHNYGHEETRRRNIDVLRDRPRQLQQREARRLRKGRMSGTI